MKRSTRVDKPQRGEQEPFSRQLANERKECRRLDEDCKARVDTVEKSAQAKISEANDEKETALAGEIDARYELEKYLEQHRDFARVAPILRSRSFFRRLWWGLRFAVRGMFEYEVAPGPDSVEVLRDRLGTILRSAEAAGIELGDDPDYSICQSFRKASA